MNSWGAKRVSAVILTAAVLLPSCNSAELDAARETGLAAVTKLEWIDDSDGYADRIMEASNVSAVDEIVVEASATDTQRNTEYWDCLSSVEDVILAKWLTTTPDGGGAQLELFYGGNATLTRVDQVPEETAQSDTAWIEERIDYVKGWSEDLIKNIRSENIRLPRSEALVPGVSCSIQFVFYVSAYRPETTRHEAVLTIFPGQKRATLKLDDVAEFSRDLSGQ